ncbi:MAG TPA: alpha-ketoacid dehydrogenase subunit beta [Moraxellaceae bacterium]|nr:alpha-ketoacid dehydrogenase subunit beta [Moraxellaceae bacterium]
MLLTIVEAVDLALARALAEDERVVVLGEDVGRNGGVFRATAGLRERFGPRRVLDTPLAENLIAGLSVGMAAQGLRPVAEIQFFGFIYAALEHLVSHAARLRNRTRGRLGCPLTVRAPFGGGIHAPEHHSESTEALLAHIPGLKVVAASSPRTAYGLLLAAIRDPDPVIVLEPERLYRSLKEEVVDDGQALPLGRCLTWREGRDVTLVAWGAMVQDCLQAALELSRENISAEVVDVASLRPLDMPTVLDSVAATRRCVIVHEACRTGGFGAEIAARIAESGLALAAPLQRVTAPDVIVPYLRLEPLYLPGVADIVRAARAAMEAA